MNVLATSRTWAYTEKEKKKSKQYKRLQKLRNDSAVKAEITSRHVDLVSELLAAH